MSYFLEKTQEQDKSIAQLEKELASGGVPKPPPRNRSYASTANFDKSEKRDEQQSQSEVPGGGPSRHRRHDSLLSADDDHHERQTEILVYPNHVSYNANFPPLGMTVASGVSRSTRVLQSAPIPSGKQLISILKICGTSNSSA